MLVILPKEGLLSFWIGSESEANPPLFWQILNKISHFAPEKIVELTQKLFMSMVKFLSCFGRYVIMKSAKEDPPLFLKAGTPTQKGRYMKEQRIKQIEQYIGSREMATVPELVAHFGVSVNTIRRDLDSLQADGKIEKIYGGARIAAQPETSSDPLMAYHERRVKHSAQKYAIAGKAAEYISEEDTIFIDTGTSTVPLLQHLDRFHHITIVTNSIYVLLAALEYPNFTVIGLPGIIKNKTASLVGDPCLEMLEHYHIQKAFMACTAFSLENGATNSSLEELTIKQKVMEKSRKRYLLVDSSKFDHAALLTFAKGSDFDAVFTDQEPSAKYVEYFREHGVELVLSEK